MNNRVAGINCNSLIISILVLTAAISCNNHPESKTTAANFSQIDSLRGTFLTIEDSLWHTWNVMINDDNEKIKSLNRLVKELVFAGGVDSSLTASLLKEVHLLESGRYNIKTMADSDLIDAYDSISSSLIDRIITLALDHEEFDRNIVMNEMIAEINESQGKILYYRIDYDGVAKVYNQFIEQNHAAMNDIDSKHVRKKLPLFELPPEQ
jgi:hypothetical protein